MKINKYKKQLENLKPGEMSFHEQSFVLNTLEGVFHILAEQSKTIQELKDEINRLKGEQGKPNISGKNQKEGGDISSEKERKPTKKSKRSKKVKFDGTRQIAKKEVVEIEDKSNLPKDIEFKGYAKSHYQNLLITSELIEVQRAIYYSKSTNKVYTAALPSNYRQGHDYTQDLKGHVGMLKYEFGMSIPKIGDFLRFNGVDITNGTISNILLSAGDELVEERANIHFNGMQGGLYSQTDTTSSRVNGANHHTHVFGNAYYTSYFTTAHKDRQTVLDLLRSEQPRVYLLNSLSLDIYAYLKIPKKIIVRLKSIVQEKELDKTAFLALIEPILKGIDYTKHEAKLLEGAYLAAYQADNPLHILVVDDAPQYKLLALSISLCWVHLGRNFKKLHPKIKYHQELLSDFLDQFWEFYNRLKKYQQKPEKSTAKQLNADFDKLFSTKTGFDQLDERIAKTKSKKKQLLVVLGHPYVPLHNNEAELAARKEVRYRDISFQTRTKRGTQAKDVFFTIIQTCKKLGLNAYAYILDRLKDKEMTALENIIFQKAFS